MDRDELATSVNKRLAKEEFGYTKRDIIDAVCDELAPELEKARKLDHIADLISAFPGKQKYPQIMEAINLLREIEGIVKEAT